MAKRKYKESMQNNILSFKAQVITTAYLNEKKKKKSWIQ